MIAQTTDLHQPLERPVKKVLVTIRCERTRCTMWALVEAVKVGNHYQVDASFVEKMNLAVRDGNSGYQTRMG